MNLPAGEYPNYPNGNKDNTHFQESGAFKIAQLVYEEILKSRSEELESLASLNKISRPR